MDTPQDLLVHLYIILYVYRNITYIYFLQYIFKIHKLIFKKLLCTLGSYVYFLINTTSTST